MPPLGMYDHFDLAIPPSDVAVSDPNNEFGIRLMLIWRAQKRVLIFVNRSNIIKATEILC